MDSLKYTGLSDEEIKISAQKFGKNQLEQESQHHFFHAIKEVVFEPLFLILIGVALVYFMLDKAQEGFLMLGALILVSGISIFQESKSRNAVQALKNLNSPLARVFRNGIKLQIPTEQLVVGDIVFLEDGNIIPADAILLEHHDLSINESILTGESLPVLKTLEASNNILFQGCIVSSGSCIARISAVGAATELGKIGKSMSEVKTAKTPLQIQLSGFVKYMVIAGIGAFVLVFTIHFIQSKSVWHALLHGLTLAMSVIPEEIPVALSTFMALGAYRMYRKKVIVRSPHTVETLGAATVICTDKTGTLTENRMELSAIFDYQTGLMHDYTRANPLINQVLEHALWASESEPFDPMEKCIHEWYGKLSGKDLRLEFKMVHEYPLSGDPPIMTHVFKSKSGAHIIAVKGSVEGVVAQSNLTQAERKSVFLKVDELARQGFRVLGVGKSTLEIDQLPPSQQSIAFEFLGLLAFYDPPKKHIEEVLQKFYKAGIQVKMITGDHVETAKAIAKQVGLLNTAEPMLGAEVMALTESGLDERVGEVHIFARMFPEAKLKIIEALKRRGEVVAMTGDGVNDGPALKAAHIGIAMGKRGSEVAKNTASLILVDDNLTHLAEAVALGRRIYENLKKAIRYILSIHIPIILIVSIPFLFFDANFEIFTPVHVIFLELIMGPTCSIIFENEPIERGSMLKPPRNMQAGLFTRKELLLSIVQGLVITLACFLLGKYTEWQLESPNPALVRTVIFSTLVFCNVFLTLINRSFTDPLHKTFRYKNKLIPFILGVSLLLLFVTIYVPAVSHVFEFVRLDIYQWMRVFVVAFLAVVWVDAFKGILKN